MILYGNNGSGKTIILQTLFHLLSSEVSKGHKTVVANNRFNIFQVKFNNHTIIRAERDGENQIGSFKMVIQRSGKQRDEYFFKASREDDQYKIKTQENEEEYTGFLRKLSDINISVYFLSDIRDFRSDAISERVILREGIRSKTFRREFYTSNRQDFNYFIRSGSGKIEDRLIFQSIDNLEVWISREVNKALDQGEVSVNRIYSDIFRSLSQINKNKSISKKYAMKSVNLASELIEIVDKYVAFSRYKVISPPIIEEILNTISSIPLDEHFTISVILQVYIDGIKARMNALKDILQFLDRLVNSFNKFYKDKEVTFNLDEGLKINAGDIVLDPSRLSSGEKQLMTLFCNLSLPRNKSIIFIIDEPEISLNIEWQRELVQTLLNLTKDHQVQFIFATHSLQLITDYKDYITPLQNLKKGRK